MGLNNFINWQDRHYTDITYNTQEQLFNIFLSNHPNLYAGVDLTSAEIDFINNHFWSYNIEPQTFEQEFTQALRECVPKYNNMKMNELRDDVFSLVKDKTEREYFDKVLERISDSKTTNTPRVERRVETVDKNAARELPMASNGDTFDDTVDWSDGASNISQNKNIVTYQAPTGEDIQDIHNTFTDHTQGKESIEKRLDYVVDIVDKINNYLIKPKSSDYLIKAVAKAFILIY